MFLRLQEGLKKHSVKTNSSWAEAYRVMSGELAGPWRFENFPWLKDMHDATEEECVGQKAAQMGYSETMLNICLAKIDMYQVSCLYVLPTKTPDASDFSASRFDPALELSPYLANLFTDVKNVGMKRAGAASLFVRGSKSRVGLKSIPVGHIILDELDEMDQHNIALAMERTSGHLSRQTWMVSTPTMENFGINFYFNRSSQDHYFFKCPSCSRHIELLFPDNIKITADDPYDPKISESYIFCKLCGATLDHNAKPDLFKSATWEPSVLGRNIHGFYINQLYSTKISPATFATKFLFAQTNPTEEQEFFNSNLGMPHVVDGAKLSEATIDACIGDYTNYDTYKGSKLVTMGVDVGKWLHYIIYEWSLNSTIKTTDISNLSTPRVLCISKCVDFEDLDILMQRYKVHQCVIDANPETRKALEFARRFWGRVRLCYFGNHVRGKTIYTPKDIESAVTVDRTSWLDLALSRFHNKKITLPKDKPLEFNAHLTAISRCYEKDRDGNPVGRYLTGKNKPDHYALACNYAEIALPIAAGLISNRDITEPI